VDLRIKPLAPLDPQGAPLPHGTEVITGVDRIVGERTVPQGAVGRVVKLDGEWIDVAVVGVGVLRYARRELSPRRQGQASYARRRASSWDALGPCVVLETIVGSHAWGLAGEGSDVDRRGVFALPLPWTVGLAAPPEDLQSADGSSAYWSVGKAIRQALGADPNTLEMLFVPSARACDPIGAWILEARDAFPSTEIYGSFGRYALSQLKRLEQSMRLAEHRGAVLDALRADPSLTLDDVARRLAALSPRWAPTEADALHQAKQYIKQLYRSLHDQGLVDANEFAALVRFAQKGARDVDLPRELRPKNAYNLLRLIATAADWLRRGEPRFEATGALKERLLAIKRGDVPLDAILREAEAMAPELEDARAVSKLPARPDIARADALLRRVGEEIARRWTTGAEGPFGANGPPPPPVRWDEP
jgi:hypothetical protein